MTTDLPSSDGPTLADLLGRSGAGFDADPRDFDLLNQALAVTGLDGALADPAADLTVLAPTDGAFLGLAQSLGYEGHDEAGAWQALAEALTGLAAGGDPVPLLGDILRYHVLGEGLDRAEILGAVELTTLLPGATIRPFGKALEDNDPSAPDPRLIGHAEPAANGSLQAIDQVLLPIDVPGNGPDPAPRPTIAGLVAASGDGFDADGADFDLLRAALDATGLTAALDDPAARLTVLAPTDDAFLGLARALGYGGTDEAGALDALLTSLGELGGGDPLPVLEDVLLHHVLDGRFSRQQLEAIGEAHPLFGPALGFAGAEIVDAEPDAAARFLPGAANVLAENGAVHAISGVLLPLDLALI
jgi:uncharacterized surface protein with fasciclin (FAS1) repeats